MPVRLSDVPFGFIVSETSVWSAVPVTGLVPEHGTFVTIMLPVTPVPEPCWRKPDAVLGANLLFALCRLICQFPEICPGIDDELLLLLPQPIPGSVRPTTMIRIRGSRIKRPGGRRQTRSHLRHVNSEHAVRKSRY